MDGTLEQVLIFLLVGIAAGWLAGILVKGGGFGLIGDLIMGVVGAFVAGFILPMLGIVIGGGILGSIVHATIGAIIFLLIVRVIKRA